MSVDDPTTKKPPRNRADTGSTSIPALTIISHPNLDRVGERVVLFGLTRGGALELSRTSPDFSQPGKVLGLPLEDPYLSRSAVVFQMVKGGAIEVDRSGSPMDLRIAGEPLEERRRLSAAECTGGIDLVLGERVVLLLHFVWAVQRNVASPFGMVGESDAIRATREAISRVADLEVPVLLRGESGTGKELVAKALHQNSRRRRAKHVSVNLSALTPFLIAAELFGAVKGAYTGAVAAKKGYFRQADGGTLFLDEVGDCPPDVQTALLRALETGEVYPVGADSPHQTDVRFIAATDSDLEARSRSGTFKEPLLHRLAAYEIWLAPLRERRDDIGRLIVHFAREALRTLGMTAFPAFSPDDRPWISADIIARMSRYNWSGNVRQLRNVVNQLVLDSRGVDPIERSERLDRLMDETKVEPVLTAPASQRPGPRPRPRDVGDDELIDAMRQAKWNVAEAARILGIPRPSVYELIEKSDRVRTVKDLTDKEIKKVLEEVGGDVEQAAAVLEVSTRGLRRRLGSFQEK